nr:reverse transcriptase domain-containing protein [Tanacetum cinerariifolium]
TLKALIGNKEKLSEIARTTMNEHCSAVILNKLPRKLGDPGKFLISCEFSGMDECLALADLGAIINLMPLSSQGQNTQNQCQNIQNQYQNMQSQMATLTEMMSKLVNANTASSSGSGTLPSNTIPNPKEDLKGITTRSGVAYQGPKTPSPFKQETKVTKDQVKNPSSQNTSPVQPSVIQPKPQASIFEPVVAPVSAPLPNVKPSIPYPSRRDNEKRRDQANEQIEKFYEIFKEMSFMDALILMPKFASTLKALIRNKEKLSEMARTTMNEHCSAVILNKLPRKLGDPGKFLIPCEFFGMDECLALADLGPSINLMPLSTSRALIDVHKGELTLRIGNEAITYNLDQTVRYSANYNQMTANKIDVIESAYEEYYQEVELKDLPHHLEYAFLKGDDKLPVIIDKELRSEEKAALIKVLKSHKRAIAWKLSDIQ